MPSDLPLPDDTTASSDLAAEYAAAREREGTQAVAELSEHLSPDEVYDAIVVVAHLNTANRVVLAAGITPDDDLY